MLVFLFYILLLVGMLSYCGGLLLDGGLDYCGTSSLDYCFCFDWVSCVFLCMLLFCGFLSLSFCNHYLGGWSLGYVLYWSMVSFLFVMGCLSCTYSYIMSLVMWEYLGVVSFFLILYYSNYTSLRATLITLFASRFGDVAFFVILLFNSSWFLDLSLFIVCPFLCLIVLSKSACFPFISWLLEAMRAPTPVSSLVHSSTLVAAGAWFLFRYGSFLGDSWYFYEAVLVLCLSSIIVSALCSLVFLDLKKIVALSTCNNISWCLLFFLLGDVFLGLVQLLSHGVCKCFLFISLGDLMSGSGGGQDSRGMFSSRYTGFSWVCVQGLLVLSLCGLPFLGVFFSKHQLLGGILFGSSPLLLFFVFLCFFLSYAYSFRLLLLLWGVSGFSVYGVVSSFLLVFLCSVFGSVCNYVVCFNIYEFCVPALGLSYFFLFLQVLGSLFGVFLYLSHSSHFGFSFWGFVLWGCEWLVSSFYFLFLCFLSVPLFVSYRWELRSTWFIYSLIGCNYSNSLVWGSLKILVVGLLATFIFFYFVV
uniref:NADH:ubiquinone reductase (H(+)-translocating) n=1 Tax=Dollfustrema vaneyi TaxID=438518 RepID=A0AAU7N3N9_9TREM